eukprot:171223-Rhodomonas_salina.1
MSAMPRKELTGVQQLLRVLFAVRCDSDAARGGDRGGHDARGSWAGAERDAHDGEGVTARKWLTRRYNTLYDSRTQAVVSVKDRDPSGYTAPICVAKVALRSLE